MHFYSAFRSGCAARASGPGRRPGTGSRLFSIFRACFFAGMAWAVCCLAAPAQAAPSAQNFEDEQAFNASLGIQDRPAVLYILYVAGTYGEMHPCPT